MARELPQRDLPRAAPRPVPREAPRGLPQRPGDAQLVHRGLGALPRLLPGYGIRIAKSVALLAKRAAMAIKSKAEFVRVA
eukprot:scaffold864_cov181-Pinguiococcus_pyrenoidosus.AAC.1